MLEVLETEMVYENPFLTVKRVRQHMIQGHTANLFIREEAHAAVFLPVKPVGQFVMLKELRVGPGKFLMEIPGGGADKNENPEHAACRKTIKDGWL